MFLCCWYEWLLPSYNSLTLPYFYLAHCKLYGLKALPDDLTCTSLPQRWSVPRGKTIQQKEIQDLLVKKPELTTLGTLKARCILHPICGILSKSHFNNLSPKPLMASIVPSVQELPGLPSVVTKFGHAVRGTVLSYQQKLSEIYVINDLFCDAYPELLLPDAGDRFENRVSICLSHEKHVSLESLFVTREVAIDL